MTDPAACPLCAAPGLSSSLRLPGLAVLRCPACGHRIAQHAAPGPAEERDYHQQYDPGAFLDALRATRERQAELLVEALRRHLLPAGALLDYGAGRGWLLEVCRQRGIEPLAGADTSELAVSGLRRQGIEAHRVENEEEPGGELARVLSFKPRVLTLLDTIEHFPPDRLVPRLTSLLESLAPEILVVKVPVPGLLYRTARLLSSCGLGGPIRQLYQMGTWPPHLSYFSPRSLDRLLAALGLAVVERIGDLDFEPSRLAERMGLGEKAAGRAVGLAAGAAAGLIRATGLYDTVLVLARPAR